MCGILGLLAYGKLKTEEEENARREAMIFMATEILQLTAPRGKEATGISTLYKDGSYTGLKMGIPSTDFINRFGKTKETYEGYLKTIRGHGAPPAVMLGHCRKSSVGNSWNNVNNHPIKVGEIVGIHNGTLTNFNTIFQKLGCKRDGSVDSEAIMRLLHHFSENGTVPFTTEMLQEVAMRLEGTYSVLSYSGNNPYQAIGLRDTRPMTLALIKPLKLMVVASEENFIQSTLWRLSKEIRLYGNKYALPQITMGDVEMKDVPDNHSVVFNLTQEIEKDTDIWDVAEKERIPWKDKKWRVASTTNHNQNKHTGAASKNTGNASASKSEVNSRNVPAPVTVQKKGNNKGTKEPLIGRVFNRDLKKYAKKNNTVDESVSVLGHTEVKLSEKKPQDVKTELSKKTKDGQLDKTKKEGQRKPAKVEELEAIDPIDNVGKNPHEITEVSVMPDTDAVEIANNKTAELKKFSNEGEVLEALELSSRQLAEVKDLPLPALANKLLRAGFKQGVYVGVTEGKQLSKISGSGMMLEKEAEKASKAQKYIRVAKNTVTILCSIIEGLSKSSVDSSVMEKAVVEALDKKKDIDSNTMSEIFSIGDMREHPVITQVRDLVQTKEHRK
jgi:hypothetical protein